MYAVRGAFGVLSVQLLLQSFNFKRLAGAVQNAWCDAIGGSFLQIETGPFSEADSGNQQLPAPRPDVLDFSIFGSDSNARDFYWYTQRLVRNRQRIV